MHEHVQCKHEIKYCKVCDVCYCEKCKKQWYNYTITYPNTATWIGDGTYPNISFVDNHAHGKDLE